MSIRRAITNSHDIDPRVPPYPDCQALLRALPEFGADGSVWFLQYDRYILGMRTLGRVFLSFVSVETMRWLLFGIAYALIGIIGVVAAYRIGRADGGTMARSRAAGYLAIAVSLAAFYGVHYFDATLNTGPLDCTQFIFVLISLLVPLADMRTAGLAVYAAAYGSLIAIFEFLTGGIPLALALLPLLLACLGATAFFERRLACRHVVPVERDLVAGSAAPNCKPAQPDLHGSHDRLHSVAAKLEIAIAGLVINPHTGDCSHGHVLPRIGFYRRLRVGRRPGLVHARIRASLGASSWIWACRNARMAPLSMDICPAAPLSQSVPDRSNDASGSDICRMRRQESRHAASRFCRRALRHRCLRDLRASWRAGIPGGCGGAVCCRNGANAHWRRCRCAIDLLRSDEPPFNEVRPLSRHAASRYPNRLAGAGDREDGT